MPELTLDQALQLAVQRHREQKLADAETIYRSILEQVPDHPQVMQLLGFVLSDAGRDSEAVGVFRRLTARHPDEAEGWDNLATALLRTGRYDEAEQAARRAIAISPNMPEAHTHLANALTESNRPELAIEPHRRAIELRPDADDAHYNLGVALQELRRLPEAIESFARAIALNPQFPEARAKIGMALLMTGQFSRGWDEYEWRMRWTSPGANEANRWDGRALSGETVVIRAEQGLGDTIQMIRYAPMVRDRGAKVVVACPAVFQRLVETVDGVSRVIDSNTEQPADTLWIPAMSLPRLFRTTQANIPANIPYVRADEARTEAFGSRLRSAKRPLVGLAWKGNPEHRDDARRSIDPRLLEPLKEANATFVCLQKDRVDSPPIEMLDWTSELRDFADTAALVSNLDLVISVDTSVVHLAGALGKPVWTMLAFVPDWRWLLDRGETPWYPTMRLFRQAMRGQWSDVVARVAEGLREFGGTL